MSFFCCWKYQETKISLVNLIRQWIPVGEGRRIARDILKKYIFSLSKLYINGDKVGTVKKAEKFEKGPGFVNCRNFATIFFLEFWKWK